MGRYLEKEDPRAEEMFERLIGYSFAVNSYEEDYSFQKNSKHQIRLLRDVIEIENCQGYLVFEPFKFEGWVDIPLDTIMRQSNVLDIPPSIFGVPFKKVRVKYKAGVVEIPQEIKDAIEEISKHLENKNVSTWNLPLSHETLMTIIKCKKERKGGD